MSEEKQEKIKISEKDKPFVLAVVASGITLTCIVIGAIGAYFGNKDMTETAIEALKFTFPLTTLSWGFYFKEKK